MLEENSKSFGEKEAVTLLRSSPHIHYALPELNDILYANSIGLTSLNAVHLFVNLKALYANGNCMCFKDSVTISKGLSSVPDLRGCKALLAVYMSDNQIRSADVRMLPRSVQVLDFSRNRLQILMGFDQLQNLQNLDVSGNSLSDESVSFLRQMENLAVLDISDNKIEEIDSLLRLVSVRALKLKGNSVTASPYTPQLIEALPALRCLDETLFSREETLHVPAEDECSLSLDRDTLGSLRARQAEYYRNGRDPITL